MIKLVLMFKFVIFFSIMIFSFDSKPSEGSIYDYEVKSITGENIKLADFKNKVILLVNTASQCGFTPQYSGLQKIYDRYKDDSFVVLGVPSDDFNQELSNEKRFRNFVKLDMELTFL